MLGMLGMDEPAGDLTPELARAGLRTKAETPATMVAPARFMNVRLSTARANASPPGTAHSWARAREAQCGVALSTEVR